MTTPTHATFGFLVGSVIGHPFIAVISSVVIDVDHLLIYAKHGVLRNPQLFWKTITQNEDPYGSQRAWLHSLLIVVPLSMSVWFFLPAWGPVLILSYLGHIVLDALDSADYWPLYPFKFLNYRGPVSFFSGAEGGLAFVFLILGFAILWLK